MAIPRSFLRRDTVGDALLKLMKAEADRAAQIKDARDGIADAKAEIHVFGLPKVEQDLAWPEGPPAPLQTLHERVRRLERTLETLGAADEVVTCRCGYNGAGPHPCHFNRYTCRQPATPRFVATPRTSLAGAQPKVGAYKTFACDACWAKYNAITGESPCGTTPRAT